MYCLGLLWGEGVALLGLHRFPQASWYASALPSLTEGIRCQRPISCYYFSEVANPSLTGHANLIVKERYSFVLWEIQLLNWLLFSWNQNLILSLSGEYHVGRHTERGIRILIWVFIQQMGLPPVNNLWTSIPSSVWQKREARVEQGSQKMGQEDSLKCSVGFKGHHYFQKAHTHSDL